MGNLLYSTLVYVNLIVFNFDFTLELLIQIEDLNFQWLYFISVGFLLILQLGFCFLKPIYFELLYFIFIEQIIISFIPSNFFFGYSVFKLLFVLFVTTSQIVKLLLMFILRFSNNSITFDFIFIELRLQNIDLNYKMIIKIITFFLFLSSASLKVD